MPPRDEVPISAVEGDRSEAIQAALDAPGPSRRVVLGPGRHQVTGLRLPSGRELHLADGCELILRRSREPRPEQRVDVVAEDSDDAMIVARDANDIAITGTGRIVAGGETYHHGFDEVTGVFRMFDHRPRVLVLDRCRKVRLEGFRTECSPMWTLHLVDCDDVTVRAVTINNDRSMPNTDGIVIDGCRDVLIEASTVRTADDGIVLKTSRRKNKQATGPCERVVVRGCVVESRSCALKIGTESFADFRDIVFEDCRVEASNRALGIFSRDGGTVENIRFSRIDVDCHETPDGFWGSGEALTVNVLDRRPNERRAGAIGDVVVEDVSGRMEGALNLHADRLGAIGAVTLRRFVVEQTAGAFGTARRMDLRPTPRDLEPIPPGDGGRRNAWRRDPEGRIVGTVDYPGGMPGLFANNVAELTLEAVEIRRPHPLPDHWNDRAALILPPGGHASPIIDAGKPA